MKLVPGKEMTVAECNRFNEVMQKRWNEESVKQTEQSKQSSTTKTVRRVKRS
jgi:hypothetical protein